MPPSRKPFSCPACGETVPGGAHACPECGACEKSGWSEDATYDGIDLPDEEFDHERFAANEFHAIARQPQRQKLWACVALVLLAVTVAGVLGGCWSR